MAQGLRGSRAVQTMRPPGGRDGRRAAALAVLLLAGGGATDDAVTPRPPAPEILGGAGAGNPNNVLSVVVATRARLADSVAVPHCPARAGGGSAAPPAEPQG